MLTGNCEMEAPIPRDRSFLTLPLLRHWHSVAEWGIVLGGTGRITSVDSEGRTYISDIKGPRNGSDPDIFT